MNISHQLHLALGDVNLDQIIYKRRRPRAARLTDQQEGPARCFGYCRVSTLQQVKEGESLDVQQRQLAGYAMHHGLEVARTFVERGVTGSRPLDQRPEGKALLGLLRAGDVVITPKLDRMFRSAQNALDVLSDLKARRISLHMIDLGGDVVTGNGISKLVFTIFAAVAEAERDRTRERIAEVKQDQRQRGRYLGGKRPFGFKVGAAGELVELPNEQTAIREMAKLYHQGLSLRAIAETMKDAGVAISHVGVKEVLARITQNPTWPLIGLGSPCMAPAVARPLVAETFIRAA